ncbi:MAG: IPT/TIG domain-containing protein [Bacteroidota bacterium]
MNYAFLKRTIVLQTIVFLALLTQSCGKTDEELNAEKVKKPSEIETLTLTFNNPLQATLTAKIVKGDYPITKYGFVYGLKPDVSDITGTVLSTAKDFAGGEFSSEISFNAGNIIADGTTLYVKAFYTDKTGTTYGKEISSVSQSFQAGVVSPMFGKTGDIIKITGKFYTPKPGDILVTMGNIEAKIISLSDTQIEVELPTGIAAYHGDKIPVSVSNRGKRVTATADFIIKANVKDFTPKTGPLTTEITFIGDNINENSFIAQYGVRIGDQNAMSFGKNPFRWMVPMDVSTAVAPVWIGFSDMSVQKVGDFVITPPVITEIQTQLIGGRNWSVLIGKDIPIISSRDYKFPYAKLGDTEIPLSVGWEVTKFLVPIDMEPGEWDFTLYAGPFSIKAPKKVVVLPHKITSISPSTIHEYEGVNLYGTFVSYTSYIICLDGVQAGSTDPSSKDGVVFFRPSSSIPPGVYTLSFKAGDKQYYSPTKLTIAK